MAENINCDPETGICEPAALNLPSDNIQIEEDKEIIYVGDPMCSWCYGLSNHLRKLKDHFPQYKFKIVVGGLRPGGGDKWDDSMKKMLKHHWEEVHKRSGQPFGYKLFDLEEFNYDTEPPCRAVVASRKWMGDRELDFYEAVTKKFYVENEDPADVNFYESICKQFNIPYQDFLAEFLSEEVKRKTFGEFQLNRQWGVRGYPNVLFRLKEELYQVSPGYSEFETMKNIVDKIVAEDIVAK